MFSRLKSCKISEPVYLNFPVFRLVMTLFVSLFFTTVVHGNIVYSENFEKGGGGWTSQYHKKITLDKNKNNTDLVISARDSVTSPMIKLNPANRYELSLNFTVIKRGLFLIEIQEYNKKGQILTVRGMERIYGHHWRTDLRNGKPIPRMLIPFDCSPDGGNIKIILRKWNPEKYSCRFDNLEIRKVSSRKLMSYTEVPLIKKDVLTRQSLMLPGPDGVLYPNFTNAGIQEWKMADAVFEVDSFGAVANDKKDDSEAFGKACDAAVKAKGGIIKFGPGVYRLTRKFLINSDRIVIRGAGMQKTKIVFNLPDSQVFIGSLAIGPRVLEKTPVNIYFPGKGAKEVKLSIDGEIITKWSNPAKFKVLRTKGFSQVSIAGKKLVSFAGKGRKVLKAEVEYKDTSKRVTVQCFEFGGPNLYSEDSNAIITFNAGYLGRSSKILIKDDLQRGENEVTVADTSQIKVGDYIRITAPVTESWNKLSLNTCRWGNYRQVIVRVKQVKNNNKIILDQPVKCKYPVEAKSYIQLVHLIQFCAVEDFTIDQEGKIQKDLKIGTILFRNAVNCKADNIKVIMTGFRPVYAAVAKNCQILNCVFDGSWDPIRTLAYAGFDYAWDCLMDNCETFGMRHGPILNWASSGNVIRRSVFHESDAQFHAGWCHDNLFEQCRIESTTKKHSGYGYGIFATSFNDSSHGPNGPRNVIYNCDSISMKSSVFMGGGGNHGWMFMYNRLISNSGAGIIQRFGCSNTRIQGNVFVLKDSRSPVIYYESIDSKGDIVINNKIYGGNKELYFGGGKPRIAKNNSFLPYKQDVPKPTPTTPSIYEWQLKNFK